MLDRVCTVHTPYALSATRIAYKMPLILLRYVALPSTIETAEKRLSSQSPFSRGVI